MRNGGWRAASIAAVSVLLTAVVVGTRLPLGIPGEWTWDRAPLSPLFPFNLTAVLPAAALLIGVVAAGARRFAKAGAAERHGWRALLTLAGASWLLAIHDLPVPEFGLSKSAWVLYYRGPSGYFSEAREHAGDLRAYLRGYEARMKEGDVLHLGTHPPGLVIVMRGFLGLCEASPAVRNALLAATPSPVDESFDVIGGHAMRGRHPLRAADRAALWLAGLCAALLAAATVWPISVLLESLTDRATAWRAAAFWPLVPSAAIFWPKSDLVLAFFAASIAALWLRGWRRGSYGSCAAAAVLAWMGMVISLALLPVACFLGVAMLLQECWEAPASRPPVTVRRKLGILAASLAAFLAATFCFRQATGCSLFQVWISNLTNHAGFYERYSRSYWGWLLVNPIELIVAVGPLTGICGLVGAAKTTGRFLNALAVDAPEGAELRDEPGRSWADCLVLAAAATWLMLWLSGKNSGETARLWIFLMPSFPVLLGLLIQPDEDGGPWSAAVRARVWTLWGLQALLQLVLMSRLSGFQVPALPG